ncbi:MAG: MATE family efflux transporter [Alphaproteobacteria bacterium]|nr:MATE family efflux transporter [Alphaproteobacteria bacterium]
MQYSYRKILEISVPILLGMIIHQLVGMTDTAFLGRVGSVELGASALAGVFYVMIFMLAAGFGVGVQVIISRRNGEQNFEKIGSVVYQGISFLLISAIFFVVATLLFAPYVLEQIISSEDVLEKTLVYLNVRIYGLLFAFPIVIFRSFFIGITQTKVLTYNAIIILGINIVLDYLLIFGKLGFPEMGISGAALASVIAEFFAALFFVLYILLKIDLKKYGFLYFIIYKMSILKQIMRLSVWTMLQYFISMATWFLFLIAIENLGEESLAISNILRNVSAFPFMIVAALGATANTITGNLIGEGLDIEVRSSSLRVVKLTYLLVAGLSIIMLAFPQMICRIYTDDLELIQKGISAYYASFTTYATLVPGMILLSVISGTGKTKDAMYLELVSLVAYTLNVWYVVMYLRADLYICWTCEHSYNILLSILTYIYLRRNKWCCQIV